MCHGIANSVDPDPIVPLGAFYIESTFAQTGLVWKFRSIMILLHNSSS